VNVLSTAFSNRSDSVLPGIGGAGCVFMGLS